MTTKKSLADVLLILESARAEMQSIHDNPCSELYGYGGLFFDIEGIEILITKIERVINDSTNT